PRVAGWWDQFRVVVSCTASTRPAPARNVLVAWVWPARMRSGRSVTRWTVAHKRWGALGPAQFLQAFGVEALGRSIRCMIRDWSRRTRRASPRSGWPTAVRAQAAVVAANP